MLYMSEFNDDLTEIILGIQSIRSDENNNIRKRISYLATESFQNVIRHSSEISKSEAESNPSFFLTRSIQSNHFIVTANPIKLDVKNRLSSKLELIHSLNREELREYYLSVLSNQEISLKGGAGLGLIEMSRKSKNPIQYHFEKINDWYSFFLQLKIDNPVVEQVIDLSLTDARNLYKICKKKQILFLLKGDFSLSAIDETFNLIRSNIEEGNGILHFDIYQFNLIADMLHVLNHTSSIVNGIKAGMLVIAIENERYAFSSSNYITEEKYDCIDKIFKKASSMNMQELKTFYKELPDDKRKIFSIDLLNFFTLEEELISYTVHKVAKTDLLFFTIKILF